MSLRVLITNIRNNSFGGAESFVRDLALGLERRGHWAAVFSDDYFRGGRPLEADSVRVVRDLESLPFAPDVIHGQYTLDVMLALIKLADVPALYHCHGAIPLDVAPIHPRIYRYLAMSPTLLRRLTVEFNIDESATAVILNGVDLSRFATVREPPSRPRRALFFNGWHRPDSDTVAAIRQATATCGLQLECIGRPFDNVIDCPERVLCDYDIVFASGRSAIEAIACGCAVIVLGSTSCGELVDPATLDRLRRANFSIAVNSPPPSVARISGEIARYAAEDCALVTQRLRSDADGERTIAQLEEIYETVIALHRASPQDHDAEQDAIAQYFRDLTPLLRLLDESHTNDGMAPLLWHTALRDASLQLTALEHRRSRT